MRWAEGSGADGGSPPSLPPRSGRRGEGGGGQRPASRGGWRADGSGSPPSLPPRSGRRAEGGDWWPASGPGAEGGGDYRR
uniref:Uncharacterized protein n=1 Tax=Oryza barthii TaxID=65489 RepID=A0A0D3FSX2_9ORYZ